MAKEGWNCKTLGEVSTFQNGFAFKSNLFRKSGLPIVRISNIQNEEIQTDDIVYFHKEDYPVNFDNYKIFPNDILIAMSGGTTGKLGINTSSTIFYQNQRVGVIRENKKFLNHKYLFYYLHTKSEESLKIAAGAAQPNLSTAQIKGFIIPLPSLTEQQRIVDILDAEFAKIDALKANAERNLQNAQDLFQAALKKELEPKDGWETATLGKVSDIARGGSPRPIKSFLTDDPNGIRWIKIGDTEVGGKYICSTKERIKREGMRSSRYVKAGDFLLSNSMSFGRPYILKVDGCIHDGWLVIRDYEKTFTQDFLYYLLLSPSVVKQFEEGARGSTVRNLNTDIVSSVRVSYPNTLEEQSRLVSVLEDLNKRCQSLQDNYTQTLTLCDDLKQALLRKAFNGEL